MNYKVEEAPQRKGGRTKYTWLFELIAEIDPGTGKRLTVPEGEVDQIRVAARSISADVSGASYRKYRLVDRTVETRVEGADEEGMVWLDIYVEEVER